MLLGLKRVLNMDENDLLKRRLTLQRSGARDLPAAYDLLQGLAPAEILTVAALLERRRFRAGDVMARIGDPSSEVFFIASGLASVTIPVSGGIQKRLGVFSAGMALGEMGFLDRGPRSAAITADTDVECDLLKVDEFERLTQTHPRITIVMFKNLALCIADGLRKATRAVSAFDYGPGREPAVLPGPRGQSAAGDLPVAIQRRRPRRG